MKLALPLVLLLSAVPLAAETHSVLPQRLSGPNQGLHYVCGAAKSQGRALALVLRKTHACDNAEEESARQCMLFTQTISDGCLKSVRERFAVFHIRLGHYPNLKDGQYTVFSDQQAAWNTWDAELTKEGFGPTPGLILVDVAKCRIMSQVFLYDVDFRGNRTERVRALLATLEKETASSMSAPEKEGESELAACFMASPAVGHPEIWRRMNEQAGPRPVLSNRAF